MRIFSRGFCLYGINIEVNSDLETLKTLIRELVKEHSSFSGSHPEESYHDNLLDDPAYKSDSVYVPRDIKSKIDKWAENMGLKSKRRKKK